LALLLLFIAVSASAGKRYQHLYIVSTNDIHGGLAPSDGFWMSPQYPPPIGNAPAAITVIRELRAEAERKGYGFLFFDTGDLFSGTPIGEFSRGQSVIDFLNSAGCDLHVPGNHDFDLGLDVFTDLVRRAQSPFVCANIVKQGTDSLWPVLLPDTIFERAGIRVGVFGLLTHYMKNNSTEKSFGGLDVLRHYVAGEREVARLKARGADIIVGATHIGYSHDRNLVDSIPGIDVIIGGHSHTGLQAPTEFPRYHTIVAQTYGRLTSLGLLDLTIDTETRRIAGYTGDLIELNGDEIALDTATLRQVNAWRSQSEVGFDVVVGTARRLLTRGGNDESPMGNLVTDAMREAFQGDVGIHMGVRNNLGPGDITYREVYRTDPFGNTVVTLKLTGAQLWDVLEVGVNGHHAMFQLSGAKLVYSPGKPAGKRLVSVEVGGLPLDTARTYRVVTNSYLATGSGEYAVFLKGSEIEDTYSTIREVLTDYIKKHSPVDAHIEGRILTR
jgi:2',3'-cyclic-nucleotide 2'-phosphodiesterase (5'-nucleotidase family)